MFLKLALRNVFRNRRRTLITESAIVLGVLAIVFISSFLNGFRESWANGLIDTDSAHLTVLRSDYLENIKSHSPKLSLRAVDEAYRKIDGLPYVEGAIAKLDIGGMIGTGDESTTFWGAGVDVERQARALPQAYFWLAEGVGLKVGDANGAVLGAGLAKSLHKKVGDSVLLATNTIDGQVNAIEVTIRGLLQTNVAELNDNFVLVPLGAAQDLLAAPNRASKISVRLKPGVDLDKAQADLGKVVAAMESGAIVKTWVDMNAEFSDVNNMFLGITFVVGIILFIVVAAGVANTMMMCVFERTREIGTIMAIGTSPRQVTRLFLLEGAFIGLVGVGIGLVIGLGLTFIVAHTGISIRPPSSTASVLIRPIAKMQDSLLVIALVLCMTGFATFFPARFASRLDPIEALRRN